MGRRLEGMCAGQGLKEALGSGTHGSTWAKGKFPVIDRETMVMVLWV